MRRCVTLAGPQATATVLASGARATLSVLIVCKLVVSMRPVDVFGEAMMLVYYGYADAAQS